MAIMTIYLDNAATSYPKPESVYQAVLYAMREVGASPGRGGYRSSIEASRILLQTREAIASLFSIPDSSRIIFTHSATEALNIALRSTLAAGEHLITTSMEHNSLLRPLFAMSRHGVEVTTVQADRSGMVDPYEIRRAVRPETKMIAMAHISNVSGSIQPIAAIADIAKEASALFLLDAAQSAGNEAIDVIKSGIDLLAVPGHKGLFGPQGTGFLYVSPKVSLKPFLYGGTGGGSSFEDQPSTIPDGFEAGTHNLPGIAGLKAGVEFILETGVSVIAEKERIFISHLLEKLADIPQLKIFGTSELSLRGGLVSFNIAGTDPAALAFMLDHRFDIALRSGLHCAPAAHRTLGTFPEGTVRVSPGWFTKIEEIAIFCDAIVECCKEI